MKDERGSFFAGPSKAELRDSLERVLEAHLEALEAWKRDATRRESGISASERIWALTEGSPADRVQLVSGKGFLVEAKGGGEGGFFAGVVKRIGRAFWPWRSSDPRFGNSWEAARRRVAPGSFDPSKVARSCPTWGVDHGIIVHQQIARCVECLELGRAVPPLAPDPCVLDVFACLLVKKWIPMRSEVPVFDESLRIVTAIDMLVVEEATDALIFLELKTNYESQERKAILSDRDLAPPMEWLKDCPEIRHTMQVAATILVSVNGFGVSPDDAYLMYAMSKRRGVELTKLAGWARDDRFFAELRRALSD